MNSASKKILAGIFILMIFFVGIGTTIQAKEDLKDFDLKKDLQENKEQIESIISNDFQSKTDWVNINGGFQRALGVTVLRDPDYDVHKLSNGQIMYDLPERDMTKYAGYVEELDQALKEQGVEFLYVQIPFKIKDDSYMPPGTHANGNENADQMVALLREKGVNTLDLRDNIAEEGLDWTSLFFKTDHHWKPETAMWAADIIAKRIHDDYGYPYDPSFYDPDNYDKKVYENWMLGSIGRRTGVWYDGLDDLTIFDPKFKTDLTFWGKNKKGDDIDKREGTFHDSMYDWENLQKRADFERNTYSTYLGKDYAIAEITNHLSDSGLNILLIRESFSCALTPFLCLGADKITAIDLRRYNEMSVPELCEEKDIDLVIQDYNPSAFSKNQFDFFDKGW